MTDELDPKLREFETRLRRLKPYCVSPSRPPRDWKRIIACTLATTATALAIVCMTPTSQDPSGAPSGGIASSKVPLHQGLTPPAPASTMRQQLTRLLAEMDVTNPVAERKPEYPVIEIAVNDAPPKENISPPFERLRLRFDDHELSMF